MAWIKYLVSENVLYDGSLRLEKGSVKITKTPDPNDPTKTNTTYTYNITNTNDLISMGNVRLVASGDFDPTTGDGVLHVLTIGAGKQWLDQEWKKNWENIKNGTTGLIGVVDQTTNGLMDSATYKKWLTQLLTYPLDSGYDPTKPTLKEQVDADIAKTANLKQDKAYSGSLIEIGGQQGVDGVIDNPSPENDATSSRIPTTVEEALESLIILANNNRKEKVDVVALDAILDDIKSKLTASNILYEVSDTDIKALLLKLDPATFQPATADFLDRATAEKLFEKITVVSALAGEVTGVKAQQTTNTQEITDIKTEQTTQNTNITALQTQQATNTTLSQSNKQEITVLQSASATQDNKVDSRFMARFMPEVLPKDVSKGIDIDIGSLLITNDTGKTYAAANADISTRPNGYTYKLDNYYASDGTSPSPTWGSTSQFQYWIVFTPPTGAKKLLPVLTRIKLAGDDTLKNALSRSDGNVVDSIIQLKQELDQETPKIADNTKKVSGLTIVADVLSKLQVSTETTANGLVQYPLFVKGTDPLDLTQWKLNPVLSGTLGQFVSESRLQTQLNNIVSTILVEGANSVQTAQSLTSFVVELGNSFTGSIYRIVDTTKLIEELEKVTINANIDDPNNPGTPIVEKVKVLEAGDNVRFEHVANINKLIVHASGDSDNKQTTKIENNNPVLLKDLTNNDEDKVVVKKTLDDEIKSIKDVKTVENKTIGTLDQTDDKDQIVTRELLDKDIDRLDKKKWEINKSNIPLTFPTESDNLQVLVKPKGAADDYTASMISLYDLFKTTTDGLTITQNTGGFIEINNNFSALRVFSGINAVNGVVQRPIKLDTNAPLNNDILLEYSSLLSSLGSSPEKKEYIRQVANSLFQSVISNLYIGTRLDGTAGTVTTTIGDALGRFDLEIRRLQTTSQVPVRWVPTPSATDLTLGKIEPTLGNVTLGATTTGILALKPADTITGYAGDINPFTGQIVTSNILQAYQTIGSADANGNTIYSFFDPNAGDTGVNSRRILYEFSINLTGLLNRALDNVDTDVFSDTSRIVNWKIDPSDPTKLTKTVWVDNENLTDPNTEKNNTLLLGLRNGETKASLFPIWDVTHQVVRRVKGLTYTDKKFGSTFPLNSEQNLEEKVDLEESSMVFTGSTGRIGVKIGADLGDYKNALHLDPAGSGVIAQVNPKKGIDLNSDKAIEVKLDNTTNSNNLIKHSDDGLIAKVDVTTALNIDSNAGLQVQVDGKSIEVDANNKLAVKDMGITEEKLSDPLRYGKNFVNLVIDLIDKRFVETFIDSDYVYDFEEQTSANPPTYDKPNWLTQFDAVFLQEVIKYMKDKNGGKIYKDTHVVCNFEYKKGGLVFREKVTFTARINQDYELDANDNLIISGTTTPLTTLDFTSISITGLGKQDWVKNVFGETSGQIIANISGSAYESFLPEASKQYGITAGQFTEIGKEVRQPISADPFATSLDRYYVLYGQEVIGTYARDIRPVNIPKDKYGSTGEFKFNQTTGRLDEPIDKVYQDYINDSIKSIFKTDKEAQLFNQWRTDSNWVPLTDALGRQLTIEHYINWIKLYFKKITNVYAMFLIGGFIKKINITKVGRDGGVYPFNVLPNGSVGLDKTKMCSPNRASDNNFDGGTQVFGENPDSGSVQRLNTSFINPVPTNITVPDGPDAGKTIRAFDPNNMDTWGDGTVVLLIER